MDVWINTFDEYKYKFYRLLSIKLYVFREEFYLFIIMKEELC